MVLIFERPKIKHYQQRNEKLIRNLTFYLEDDDGNAVDFRGETVTFTILLIKTEVQNISANLYVII